MNGEDFCLEFQQAVELIGRRWCGTIARALLPGPRRFTELRRAIPDISDRALSQRLRELEAEGVVIRRVSTGPPVKVAYELSSKGRDLEHVIDGVERWAHSGSGAHPRTTRMSVRTHDRPRVNAWSSRRSRPSDFSSRSSAACISAVFPASCSALVRRDARPPSSIDRTCASIDVRVVRTRL